MRRNSVSPSIVQLSTSQLLTNRSDFMVDLGVAGVPVSQLWPHMTGIQHLILNGTLPDGSAYASVCSQSPHSKSKASGDKFLALYTSVCKDGVKEPLKVYDIGGGLYELVGGHHRAVCAHLAGKSVPVVLKEFDPLKRIKVPKALHAAYADVEKHENLAKGMSYNPFPGRRHVRSDLRLPMIYRAIVDSRGTTMLDVGCNDGYFGVTFASHAFGVTLIDPSNAYIRVVNEKLAALDLKALTIQTTIRDFPQTRYDVVLYTDVFYHVAIRSLDAALEDWRRLLWMTRDRMIFSPGNKNKLQKCGFTEKIMWDEARKAGFSIRMLGFDEDRNYGRPLFLLVR